jgi:hypothetical protein
MFVRNRAAGCVKVRWLWCVLHACMCSSTRPTRRRLPRRNGLRARSRRPSHGTKRRASLPATATASMAIWSSGTCEPWESGTSRPRPDRLAGTLLPNAWSAQSAGTTLITASSRARRSFAGSCSAMRLYCYSLGSGQRDPRRLIPVRVRMSDRQAVAIIS